MTLGIHITSWDWWHILITALLFLWGLISIIYSIPRVSKIQRPLYYLAAPIWAGWVLLYGIAVVTFVPRPDSLTWGDVLLRILLFGIALEGILVPYVDRLEESKVIKLKDVGGFLSD